MGWSAQGKKKRKRNGSSGWACDKSRLAQASGGRGQAAARFSERAKGRARGICTGPHTISCHRQRAKERLHRSRASGARFGPPFCLYPITLPCSAARCCCAGSCRNAHAHTTIGGGYCGHQRANHWPCWKPETNPAMAHTLAARPRSPRAISSPAYPRLGPGHKCPRSRSVSLCCFCLDLCDTRPCLRVMGKGDQTDCLPQQVSLLLSTRTAGRCHAGL